MSLNISSDSKQLVYRVSESSQPCLVDFKDVIVKVYAASMNPIDVKRAAGALKIPIENLPI